MNTLSDEQLKAAEEDKSTIEIQKTQLADAYLRLDSLRTELAAAKEREGRLFKVVEKFFASCAPNPNEHANLYVAWAEAGDILMEQEAAPSATEQENVILKYRVKHCEMCGADWYDGGLAEPKCPYCKLAASKEREQGLREEIQNLLASARPNERDNPAMFKAWEEARKLLSSQPPQSPWRPKFKVGDVVKEGPRTRTVTAVNVRPATYQCDGGSYPWSESQLSPIEQPETKEDK
jgi:hypothetical protein